MGEEVTQLRSLTVTLLAFGLCGCDSVNPDQKKRSPDNQALVDSLIKKYGGDEQKAGRYKMTVAGTKTLKIDTATGQTWELKDSRWQPISTDPANCIPTSKDPCTNVWLYKDPDHLREAPAVGTVAGGLRFTGGDASKRENWYLVAHLPASAAAQLKEGINTTFNNGQTWTLRNGKPDRVYSPGNPFAPK